MTAPHPHPSPHYTPNLQNKSVHISQSVVEGLEVGRQGQMGQQPQAKKLVAGVGVWGQVVSIPAGSRNGIRDIRRM